MTQFHKFLPVGLLSTGLLLLASCQEGTSKNPNPNPKTPPLTIKVTGPEGFRQGDSASFRRIMNGEMEPDTLHLAKPTTTKHHP
jgi:hypothetical protein